MGLTRAEHPAIAAGELTSERGYSYTNVQYVDLGVRQMLALEKWGQGRYKPLVMFAHSVALGAEAAYELCVSGRDPKFRNCLAKIDDVNAWLANYKKQALLVIDPEFGKEFFGVWKGQELGGEVAKCLESLRQYSVATPEERKQSTFVCASGVSEQKVALSSASDLAPEFDAIIDEVYDAHLQDIRCDIAGETEGEAQLELLFKQSLRAKFFFLVALPCWIEYGASPTELFTGAQTGGFEAIRKLLNLDSMCLSDPQILVHFQKHMQSNEVIRDMLLRAMEYKPLSKLKRKAVKVVLAALMYKVFNRVHDLSIERQLKLWKNEVNEKRQPRHELTFPALKRLFDAVYSDVHEEGIEDPDFSGITPEGFALSVKRQLDFWPDF